MMRVHRHPGIFDCTCPFPGADRPMWPRRIPGPGLLARLAVWLRRRRDHEPRAIALVLALPPAPPTFREQVTCGRATIAGKCAWCDGPWDPCAHGCIRRRPQRNRPIAMPVAGPGRPQNR